MIKTQIPIPSPKEQPQLKRIAIFGSADVDPEHPLYRDAFNVARTLAYHDKIIVDGGGPGVMDAATKGAQSAGGSTIVVTFYPDDAPEFEGRFVDNKGDREIITANYIERMFGLMDNADAFVCFQGGTGTLSEWATAWLLAHLYYGKHKPLILYGEFWNNVMRVIKDNFFIGEKEERVYRIVKNEEELMQALEEFEAELRSRIEAGKPMAGKDTHQEEVHQNA
jgi:uncharacterized protein (TIGR00725 family)